MSDGPVVAFGWWCLPIFQVQHPSATWAVVRKGYSPKRILKNLAKAGGAGTTRVLWCYVQPASSCWQQLTPQRAAATTCLSAAPGAPLSFSSHLQSFRLGWGRKHKRLQHSLKMSTGLKFISRRIIHSWFWDLPLPFFCPVPSLTRSHCKWRSEGWCLWQNINSLTLSRGLGNACGLQNRRLCQGQENWWLSSSKIVCAIKGLTKVFKIIIIIYSANCS